MTWVETQVFLVEETILHRGKAVLLCRMTFERLVEFRSNLMVHAITLFVRQLILRCELSSNYRTGMHHAQKHSVPGLPIPPSPGKESAGGLDGHSDGKLDKAITLAERNQVAGAFGFH